MVGQAQEEQAMMMQGQQKNMDQISKLFSEMEGHSAFELEACKSKRPAYQDQFMNFYATNPYSQAVQNDQEEPELLQLAFETLDVRSVRNDEKKYLSKTDILDTSRKHIPITSEKVFEISEQEELMEQQQMSEEQKMTDEDLLEEIESPLHASERLDGSIRDDSCALLEQNIIDNIQRRDECQYKVDSNYLQTVQKDIQWHMRLLLIDWMMEVCDEFGLSRETYHLACSYTDLYLSKKKCSIDKLQLLGASCLLLACKVEEIICPRVKDFAFATDNGFTNQQIIEMEAEIQKEMEFHMYPVTLNYWCNYFMAKWDIYAQANPLQFQILESEVPGDIPLFKSDNIDDYKRFRSMMQVIDLTILDLAFTRFDKREVIAAVIYLQLGLFYKIFTRPQISTMPEIETLLINTEQIYQDFSLMTQHFITIHFNLTIVQIVPTIQFVSRFFGLDPQYEYPIIIKQKRDAKTQEEFFSYQAHIKGGIDFVRHARNFFMGQQTRQQQSRNPDSIPALNL